MEAFGELLAAIFAGAAGFLLGSVGIWAIRRFFGPADRWRVWTYLWLGLAGGVIFFALGLAGSMLAHSLFSLVPKLWDAGNA